MSAARAFLLGAQARRTGLRLARALALVALGVAALGWLRAELERRDLEAEVHELGVLRLEDVHRRQRAELLELRQQCRADGLDGLITRAALRLGLSREALLSDGSLR